MSLAPSVIRILCLGVIVLSEAEEAIDIGSRRELFVDRFLIERTEGIRLEVQRPEPREVVLVTDRPWEGNTCAYYTIFRDGEKFRMYYRGSHWDETKKKSTHREVVCYAESADGIHWTRPDLGLFEFQGSKANNIVWDGIGGHNFTPFKDTNPECKPEARYKALAHGRGRKKGQPGKRGLFAFRSPDGIRWELMHDEPVITEGAFDSQNLAFYDHRIGRYRDYHRWFKEKVRDIMTCTSEDFLTWTKPVGLSYTEEKREHLYTNAIRLYERAPHLYLGFPTRYLPDEGQRVEPVFMSSRDGGHFYRWSDPVIPEDAPEDRAGNRSNYMTWGLVTLPGREKELSVYATEAYYTGPDSRVRRFAFRVDGFVAARAGEEEGFLLTKPLVFDGGLLQINSRTAGTGSVRVQLEDPSGTPKEGFTFEDGIPATGDDIDGEVKWKSGADLSSLAGSPVRIRFTMQNADLFSFRFSPGS